MQTGAGPCQMMGPVVEEIAGEVSDAKVCKINIDEQMEIAQRYGVIKQFRHLQYLKTEKL